MFDREMIFTATETSTRFYITKGWSANSETPLQEITLDYLTIVEIPNQINYISCTSLNNNLTMLSNSGVNINDSLSVKGYLNAYYNAQFSYLAYQQVISNCATFAGSYVLPRKGTQADFVESGYRFGFNGKELDPEGMGGGGSTYDYGFRIYNPNLGKFLSVDPLTNEYPWYTPYQFAGNKPIWAIDLDGLEEYFTSSGELIGKYGTSTEVRVVFDKYVDAVKNLTTNPNKTSNSDVMNNLLYNKGSAGTFNKLDDAAVDWGIRYNKSSIDINKEFSSIIFRTIINGKPVLSYTEPSVGSATNSSSTFTFTATLKPLAAIHSHGKYLEDWDNNVFSDDWIDKNGVQHEGDIGEYQRNRLDGYVTTPNGSLLKYTFEVETLRCDMPSDPRDPTTSPTQVVSEHELKIN